MKSNFKKRLQSRFAEDVAKTQGTVKRLWELLTILTLQREFGFGRKRLKRFAEALFNSYSEFTERASATDAYDRKRRELSDIDTAIIRVLMELRKNGTDHRDILGDDDELVITDENGKQTNLDEFLDRMERRDTGG